jgi:hypothetical protein
MISPEEKARDFARVAADYRTWLERARKESDARRERRSAPPGSAAYAGRERRRVAAPPEGDAG